MSSNNVDLIHERLREELDHLGLKMAEAARLMGEESSQGLRDVCSGRKRASAELVSKLVGIGADGLYILTGEVTDSNIATTRHLPPDEELLLEAYRGMTATARKALLAELLTGGKKPRAKLKTPNEDAGINVSGSGHRVAGRDFNERKE